MEKARYLIIGSGISGTTAAETIHRSDPAGSIAIVSDEPYRLYSRIMLSKPNFFLEKIPFDQIWLKKESWYAQNNVQLVLRKSAVHLNPQAKTVTLNTGEELGYEKLLLAVGGCARRWGLPGAEKRGIFYLRTLDDAKAIMAAVKLAKAGRATSGRALAVGGGFVGFEMCDMLRLAGVDTALALRESYYWEPLLDEPSGRMIEDALEKGGVKILRQTEVKEVQGREAVEAVLFNDGTKFSCGMIIVGIGVVCPFGWLEGTGIAINRGIVTDEYLQTNLPDVWAAGDAAEFNDLILGEQIQLGNWVNAQMQGKTAGVNMAASFGAEAAKKEPFRLVSFYTTQGFGITIAFVGDIRSGQDRTIIPRGSPERGSYGRVLVKDGEIIGATLINRTAELAAISKLIRHNVVVSGKERELSDAEFDLKKL